MNTSITLIVQGTSVLVDKHGYVNITDVAKAHNKSGVLPNDTIRNWLSNISTIEFLGVWEGINNPNFFNTVEFHGIRDGYKKKGFRLSVDAWVKKTGATGIFSRLGKTGGTYAHKDIAFEFAAAISPAFKLYLIKEYQRLREIEINAENPEWNLRRLMSKGQYAIQSEAVKRYKIPSMCLPDNMIYTAYAEEGDILNIAIFGSSAKEWRVAHPDLFIKGKNQRDFASVNQLSVLCTIEGMNAEMIKNKIMPSERLTILTRIAKEHIGTLDRISAEKSLKKASSGKFNAYIKAPGDKAA